MESAVYQVSAFWDEAATVWVATSEDVPGLATEADTIEALSQKLRDIVPDLLMSNHVISADYAGAIAIQLTRGVIKSKRSSELRKLRITEDWLR